MRRRLAVLGIVTGVGLIALVPPAQSGTPSCFGKRGTKVGTDGDDVISGTSGNDVIVANGGDDTVFADSGDDLVWRNAGDDTLEGQAGNDKLSVGPGTPANRHQAAAGGGGNDLVVGADNAPDDLRGDDGTGDNSPPGDDQLKGLKGNDFMIGGAGEDNLSAGGGEDQVDATDGEKDLVNGGGGADECVTDPGVDKVRKCETSS